MPAVFSAAEKLSGNPSPRPPPRSGEGEQRQSLPPASSPKRRGGGGEGVWSGSLYPWRRGPTMKLSFLFYAPIADLNELDRRMGRIAALGYQGIELSASHPWPYPVEDVMAL